MFSEGFLKRMAFYYGSLSTSIWIVAWLPVLALHCQQIPSVNRKFVVVVTEVAPLGYALFIRIPIFLQSLDILNFLLF